MNVVLIGYRGTGKSSVAELVAMCSNMQVYRMDDEIERRAGCSIVELVREKGWDEFRRVEEEVAREAGALDNYVIDAGGGVVQRPDNVAALKANGALFWLTASADTIKERIAGDAARPPLTGGKSILEEVDEMLAARLPLYAEAADHVIETEGRTLGEIANEIVDIVCMAS